MFGQQFFKNFMKIFQNYFFKFVISSFALNTKIFKSYGHFMLKSEIELAQLFSNFNFQNAFLQNIGWLVIQCPDLVRREHFAFLYTLRHRIKMWSIQTVFQDLTEGGFRQALAHFLSRANCTLHFSTVNK